MTLTLLKQIKALYQLWRILRIEPIQVMDCTRNPLTVESMSFTDRCNLKHTMLNQWLVDQGYVKRVKAHKAGDR